MKVAPRSAHESTRALLKGENNLAQFSKLILGCCMSSRELFDQASPIINYDAVENNFFRNDFLDPVDGLIYAGMKMFKDTAYQGCPWPCNRAQWVQALSPHFREFFARNPNVPEQFGRDANLRILVMPEPMIGDYDRFCDGLVDYISGVRYHLAELRTRNADPLTKRETFEKVPLSIKVPHSEAEILEGDSLMAAIFSGGFRTHSFSTGVNQFDRIYGDQARPGDAWLTFANTGGGKTVIACQTGAFTAASGKRVVIISTEVRSETCMLRSFCSHQGVNIKQMNALRGSNLTPEQDQNIANFKVWNETVGRNLRIYDYQRVSGSDFTEKLNRILDHATKFWGQQPDMVLLDWLGKTLDGSFNTSWEKANLYLRAATRMADLADELEIVTMTFAQAHPDTKNRVKITEYDTADSRHLCDPMEGALVPTSLLAPPGEEEMQTRELHRQEQMWIIPKCREAETNQFRVLRRFEIQRFVDYR